MNLAKILKQRRDAERRLEQTSPAPVFNGGAADSIEGVSETLASGITAVELAAGLAGKSDTDHAHEFVDLTDVPSAYTGEAGKVLVVKAAEDGLEFGVASSGGSGIFDFGLITESASSAQDWGTLA